jgi:hypothetical protein
VVAADVGFFAAMLHVHQLIVIYTYQLIYLLVPLVHPLYILAHALRLRIGSSEIAADITKSQLKM